MKKFVAQVLFFFVFASFAYAGWVFLWQNTGYNRFKGNINYRIGTYGNMYTRVREIPKFKNVDILFLGSSHAYRGYDIRLFEEAGYRSFNLGSSAQTPIQTKALLNRYLDSLNPKVIIYEVYPNTFCIDGVEASTDVIANDINDKSSLGMVWANKNAKVFNTLIYAGVRDAFNLNNDFIEPLVKPESKDRYVSGGYVEKEMDYNSPGNYPSNRWNFNEQQIAEFMNVLELLEAKRIPVVMVFNPISKSYYESYTNRVEFDEWISKLGDYYNYNTRIDLDDSLHFYDNNHMNQNGVTLFNEKLISDLKENNLLP